MIGATVCSGIGAPEVAMPHVDWRFAAEIDAAARAVYAHRHPNTELFGDFTVMKDDPRIVDLELLVGGTPCQSFSIAGLRQSLSDDRGNLALEFIRLANAIDDLRCADGRDDAFILWENVPGVLSVQDNAFGAFLGGLVGSDTPLVSSGGWANAGMVVGPRRKAAWRVLDAQFFGVPQRRRRVFVLAHGHSRGWACADAILSISHSLQGHTPPRRETGERIARPIAAGSARGSGYRNDADTADNLISATVSSKWAKGSGGPSGDECQNLLAVPVAYQTFGDGAAYETGDVTAPLRTGTDNAASVVAFSIMPMNSGKDYVARPTDVAQPLMAGGPVGGNQGGDFIAASAVRRLTPVECERLQGFPDDFTLVPFRNRMMADGPRYKMLGNSMAVPVVAWIGERIAMVDQLPVLASEAAA